MRQKFCFSPAPQKRRIVKQLIFGECFRETNKVTTFKVQLTMNGTVQGNSFHVQVCSVWWLLLDYPDLLLMYDYCMQFSISFHSFWYFYYHLSFVISNSLCYSYYNPHCLLIVFGDFPFVEQMQRVIHAVHEADVSSLTIQQTCGIIGLACTCYETFRFG